MADSRRNPLSRLSSGDNISAFLSKPGVAMPRPTACSQKEDLVASSVALVAVAHTEEVPVDLTQSKGPSHWGILHEQGLQGEKKET